VNALNERLSGPAAAADHDFQATQAAREQLLKEINEANSARAVFGAALSFTRRLTEAIRG